MSDFKYDSKREAVDSLRGYVYQVYQSVFAWMTLPHDGVLYLERAEDFDIEKDSVVETVQVKETARSGNITLKTKECVEAVNNYWRCKNDNIGICVKLRYLTTSSPGVERASSFSVPREGINYWNNASLGRDVDIKVLKNYMLGLKYDDSFIEYLKRSSDEEFVNDIVRNVYWDTGAKDSTGLIRAIESKLISHGDRLAVGPTDSRSAFGDLVKRVLEVITSGGDRQLLFSEFLELFEQSTSEVVSKAQARFLRASGGQALAVASGGYVPGALRGGVPALRPPVPLVNGAIRREGFVKDLAGVLQKEGVLFLVASTGKGKTSTAILVSQFVGGGWLWLGLRGHNPEYVSVLLSRACIDIELSDNVCNVIIDDIDIRNYHKYENELLSLICIVRHSGGFVILTSYKEPVVSLLESLWLSSLSVITVRNFDLLEVREMLTLCGAPKEFSSNYSKFIHTMTSGHPQLVHAKISSYKSKGWPELNFADLIEDDVVKQEKDFIRERLIEDLPSKSAKCLMYRISMISCDFRRDVALNVGSAPPPIEAPGEHFDNLVGPWVERVGSDLFRISPLVYRLGESVYNKDEIIKLHSNLAISILKTKTIDLHQIGPVLMHVLISGSEKAFQHLMVLINQLYSENFDLVAKTIKWFAYSHLETGGVICKNSGIDVYMRYFQLRVAISNRESKQVVSIYELFNLAIEKIENNEMKEQMYALSYGTILNKMDAVVPSGLSVAAFNNFVDLCEGSSFLKDSLVSAVMSERVDGIDFNTPYDLFAFLISTRVSGVDDFVDLVTAIDKLVDHRRELLFNSMGADYFTFAGSMVGSAWLYHIKNDTLKPLEVVEIFNEAKTYALKWDRPDMVWHLSEAISVMYSEYCDDCEKALVELNSYIDDYKESGAVSYAIGKVYYAMERYSDAFSRFCLAKASGELRGTEAVFADRLAAISAARCGKLEKADQIFKSAIEIANKYETLSTIAISFHAERAFLAWEMGSAREAISRLCFVLKKLIPIESDGDIKNRHLHAVVGHFLGWLYSMPHSANLNRVAPYVGMFSTLEPHDDFKEFKPVPINGAWGMLYTLAGRFGVDLKEVCGDDLVKMNDVPLSFKVNFGILKLSSDWSTDDIFRAVGISIELSRSMFTARWMTENAIDIMSDGELKELPSDYFLDRDNADVFLMGLIVAAIKIVAEDLNLSDIVERWSADVAELNRVHKKINDFIAILLGVEVEDLSELHCSFAKSAFDYLSSDLTPSRAAVFHFRMLNVLAFFGEYVVCDKEVEEIVEGRWSWILLNQRFLLRNPGGCIHTLKEALSCAKSGRAKAASILLAASECLEFSLSEDSIKFLKSLA